MVHVRNELGHKNIKNTMIYIHLQQALFQTSSDEFYSATAKDLQEACKLIETGFEYVTTFNNMMLFRKRK